MRRYYSPNIESPLSGVLAAEAVRNVAVLFHNYLNKAEGHGVLRLEPREFVSMPPLKYYTFVNATGQILVREIAGDDLAGPVKKAKVQPKAKSKEQPAAMAEAVLIEDDDDGEEVDEEEEDEEEEDEAMAKELSLLDSLAGKKGDDKKKKKKNNEPKLKAQNSQKNVPASSSSEPPSKKTRVA